MCGWRNVSYLDVTIEPSMGMCVEVVAASLTKWCVYFFRIFQEVDPSYDELSISVELLNNHNGDYFHWV